MLSKFPLRFREHTCENFSWTTWQTCVVHVRRALPGSGNRPSSRLQENVRSLACPGVPLRRAKKPTLTAFCNCSTGDVIGAGSAPSREVAKSSARSGTMSGAGKDQRYWKFECVRSGDTLEKALRCLVCDWRTTVPGVHLPLRQREVQRFMCSLPSCDKGSEFGAYTLGMDQPPSARRIWAPDDKARTMAWDVSEKDYLLAGLKQMSRDTMHWKMVPDSPETVAEFYEGLHGLVGRKERLYLSRKKGWTGSVVPYTYCTIKSKCHDQSAERRGRTCQKPGHSCMRKIISWWHHPAPSAPSSRPCSGGMD